MHCHRCRPSVSTGGNIGWPRRTRTIAKGSTLRCRSPDRRFARVRRLSVFILRQAICRQGLALADRSYPQEAKRKRQHSQRFTGCRKVSGRSLCSAHRLRSEIAVTASKEVVNRSQSVFGGVRGRPLMLSRSRRIPGIHPCGASCTDGNTGCHPKERSLTYRPRFRCHRHVGMKGGERGEWQRSEDRFSIPPIARSKN